VASRNHKILVNQVDGTQDLQVNIHPDIDPASIPKNDFVLQMRAALPHEPTCLKADFDFGGES